MKQIILASNNPGKIREFQAIFSQRGIEIIPQAQLNIPEVAEPFPTFIENALHKARHCSQHTGLPALADDSGLCVNSLGGRPGIYSARYAGEPKSDTSNNLKLLQDLAPFADKSAYYYCALVLIRQPLDPQPIIAEGTLTGLIINAPRGSSGFGYDPYFYLPEYHQTAAEIPPALKNQISHRGQAINNLLAKITNSLIGT
ncbi:MAG: RdgB/HAM1 family non-canonical purine NTP pyrophosphatase [Burkholderiales bacterium]